MQNRRPGQATPDFNSFIPSPLFMISAPPITPYANMPAALPQHPPSLSTEGPMMAQPMSFSNGQQHQHHHQQHHQHQQQQNGFHTLGEAYASYAPGPHPGPSSQYVSETSVPPPPPASAPASRKPGKKASADSGRTGSGASKKRQRASQSTAPSPPAGLIGGGAGGSRSRAESVTANVPAVLTREKKQKACANCRRAKLKCLIADDQAQCVRCLARQEKCIFYPRSHDEDWQQTMANDVYAGLAYLSDLGSAVHHLLDQLSSQGIIQPFVTSRGIPLERYEAPERDLPAMQGWNAATNKEMAAPRDRRRRTKAEEDDELEEDEYPTQEGYPSVYQSANQASSAQNLDHPPNFPPNPPQGMSWLPSRSSSGPKDLQYDPTFIQPDLDINVHPQASPVTEMARRTYSQQPSLSPTIINSGSSRHLATFDPTSNNQLTTPESHTLRSPSLSSQQITHQQTQTGQPGPEYQPQLLRNDSSRSQPGPSLPTEPVLGSDDPRTDIIKMGMVPSKDASDLVDYCHSHLGQFLFGYQLEFGHFPYLPGGPTLITPLILAVHCLLASERMPQHFHYHYPLSEEVKTLLMNNPAVSWRSSEDVQADLALGAMVLGEDEIDPELGIGPEELVGMALLSLWTKEREHACLFARMAFQYARGWINMLSSSESMESRETKTVAETIGFVTELREASPREMARIWLLCYLADGIANVTGPVSQAPPQRDPSAYCSRLIPDPLPPADEVNQRDLVLTSHARILYLFSTWQSTYASTALASASPALTLTLQRLTNSIDLQIDDIQRTVREIVPENWACARQLDVFSLWVQTTMFALLTKYLTPRQRPTYVAKTVEVAMDLLERCAAWGQIAKLQNLPREYHSMIMLAARVMTDIVISAADPKDPTVCSVTAEEVDTPLRQIMEPLYHHSVSACQDTLARCSRQLQKLI